MNDSAVTAGLGEVMERLFAGSGGLLGWVRASVELDQLSGRAVGGKSSVARMRFAAAVSSFTALTATQKNTMKLLLLGLLLLFARPLPAQEVCTLDRVIDGDTFECRDGRRVRLLFVDAPEREQAGGASATAALAGLVHPGDVLRLDSDGLDRYGRTLAYVWRDTTLVNRRLVEEGYAVVEDYGDDPRFRAVLIRAEREAARRRRGLWAAGGFGCRPRAWRAGRCRSR